MWSACVARRGWSVRRWRRSSGHTLVEGFECHCAEEGGMSKAPNHSWFSLSPSPLRFCASTARHLGIPRFNIIARSRNQMEPRGQRVQCVRQHGHRATGTRNRVRTNELVRMSGHTGRTVGTTSQRQMFRFGRHIPSNRRVSPRCSSCKTSARRRRPTTRIG